MNMDTSFRIGVTQGVPSGGGSHPVVEAPPETAAQPADGVSVSSTPTTAATKPELTPEQAGQIGGQIGKRVAESLIPGGRLFANPFWSPDTVKADSESIALHEMAHGILDEPVQHTKMAIFDDEPYIVGSRNVSDEYWRSNGDRPLVGGMLGGLFGSGTMPVALTERLREATDAVQRLQKLEDGYTSAHMARAGNLAMQLGRDLDLSPEQAFALAHASMVYDVGKLEVDEKLLSKPGKLTDEERAAVNKHVEPSEDLLSLFNPSPETRGIVRHHHERWDGKGFPDGLAGDKIPLTARMISITDSWDAMTCDRPFRPAMSYDKARGIIESGAGTQYDPTLVKTFFDKVATRPG